MLYSLILHRTGLSVREIIYGNLLKLIFLILNSFAVLSDYQL